MTHVMIDIETVGTGATSAIVSIGAVVFDQQGVTENTFYRVVDTQSCFDMGMTTSGDTIAWWMEQSDEARKVFSMPSIHILAALHELSQWMPDNAKLWGNGASFDNAILSNAYRRCDLVQPWKFWNDRCYRTISAIFPQHKRVQGGTHHNALDDAISQANHLIQIAPMVIV